MLILAFDTTSEKGGVGIFRDTDCLALVANEGPANRYSISLFEMVERALGLAQRELREIELFAAANGPGSFTGIRVGLAAARAWGKAFGRPVRGVSVLDAMLNKVELTFDWVFPILDARRGEFFVGGFRPKTSELEPALQGEYEPADGGWVLKPESLRAFVEEHLTSSTTATCLVRAHDQVAADLRASLPAALAWQQVEGILVDAIASIAVREERSGSPRREARLDAYYIRRPDAEINSKE